MKIKQLKNRLCAIGLTASLVLTSLSSVNIGQYKVAHAASQNNILEASDIGETVSYSTILSSGKEVIVNLTGHHLVVTIDGISYTFKDNDENEDAVEKCIVDKKEKLLHIAVNMSGAYSKYCYYYCMNLLDGTYMPVYQNGSNDLYLSSSHTRSPIITIDTDALLNDEHYIHSGEAYSTDLRNTYSVHYLNSWMNQQEYNLIYGGNYIESHDAVSFDSHSIEKSSGTLKRQLSDGTEVSVTLSDSTVLNYTLTVTTDTWQDDIQIDNIHAVSLDPKEDLLHIFNIDDEYSCMDLRTGNQITIYHDAETGEYCTPSLNAVKTTSNPYLVDVYFFNNKYFAQLISLGSDISFNSARKKRLLTRYEYNQLSEGISPCNGTVYNDSGIITYNRGTKRKILCSQGTVASQDKYGLDEYGTVWFMSRYGLVYWYNEKIADELELLGRTSDSRYLEENDNSVKATEFCWNSSHSVITGYYDESTLKKEELPSYNELREMLGLGSQPTEAPSSDPYATSTPTMTPTSTPANTPTDFTGGSGNTSDNYPTDILPSGMTPTPVSDGEGAISSAKRMPTITSVSSIKKAYGTKMFLLNVTTDSDGEVTYQSSNKKVVTVNSYGAVTIKGYGNAAITVKTAETSKFKSASKMIKIFIVPAKLKNFKAKSKSPGKITFTWKNKS